MKNNKLLSQNGFTLIEVMVVVGIGAIIALAMADLTAWTLKSANAGKFAQDRVILHEEIRQLLSDQTACTNTLAQLNGQLNNANAVAVPSIRDALNNVSYNLNVPYGVGNVLINQMTLTALGNVSPVTANLDVTYTTNMQVVGSNQANGGANNTTRILVRLLRDAGGNVTNCLSQAMMSDGIWRKANNLNNDIYFFGGNLGVGPNSINPAFPLDVSADAVQEVARLSSSGADTQITLNNTTATGKMWKMGSAGVGSGVTPSSFYIQNATDNVLPFAILDNGRVGVGTWTPTSQLEVNSFTNNSYLRVTSPLASTSALSFSDITNGESFTISRSAGTRNLGFWSAGAGTVMEMDFASGSVGIGHNAPSNLLKLDINGGMGVGTTTVAPDGSYYSNNSFFALRNNGNIGYMGMRGNNLTFTSPGPIDFGQDIRVTGAGSFTGNVYTAGIYTGSDSRIKKDVKDLGKVLEQVLKVRPIYYTPIKSEKNDRHIGVIAQEIEKLFPELVTVRPDGFKTVAYAEFAVIAVAGLQELHNEFRSELKQIKEDRVQLRKLASDVEALKKENTELKAQIKEIQEQLRRLKQ